MQNSGCDQQAVSATIEVMDRHLFALNERSTPALAATLHFHHFRVAGAELKVWETADSYFDDFKARAGQGWAYKRLA